jgi:hypothetical protein
MTAYHSLVPFGLDFMSHSWQKETIDQSMKYRYVTLNLYGLIVSNIVLHKEFSMHLLNYLSINMQIICLEKSIYAIAMNSK